MVTIQNINGNTKRQLTWVVSALNARFDLLSDKAGKLWYNNWFPLYDVNNAKREWATLTNAEKINVIDLALIRLIKESARSQYINDENETDIASNQLEATTLIDISN